MTIDLKIRTALELAVAEALEKVGKTAFKRTSMFMSGANCLVLPKPKGTSMSERIFPDFLLTAGNFPIFSPH